MSRFVRQLTKLNERLCKIQGYANSAGDKDITDITVNIEILAEIWTDFRSIASSLPDDAECVTLETEIEKNYKTIRAILLKLQLGQSNINPKIEESNPILKDLKGKALELIDGLTLSNETYDEAWEKLNYRYNKPDQIAFSYINSFINQPSTTRSSALEVRRIFESADEAIRGLRALGEEAEKRDIWVIYLLLNKLDPESRLLWSRESTGSEMPSLQAFFKFLNNRAAELESAQLPSKSYSTLIKPVQLHNSTIPQCIKCSQHHFLYQCPDFKQFSVITRTQFVNQNQLCHNCLNSGHLTNNCRSKYVCRLCSMKHHTLLHNQRKLNFSDSKLAEAGSYHISPEQHNMYYPPANIHEPSLSNYIFPNSTSHISQGISQRQLPISQDKAVTGASCDIKQLSTQCSIIQHPNFNQQGCPNPQLNFNQQSVSNPNHSNQQTNFKLQSNFNEHNLPINNSRQLFPSVTSAQTSLLTTRQCILPTALVYVKDSFGNQSTCRVLLDSGSQASFITEKCVSRLGLKRANARIPVTGLASVKAGTTNGLVRVDLSSRYNNKSITVNALVLPNLTSMIPSRTFDSWRWKSIQFLELADPMFYNSNHIDIIIGSDYFFKTLENETVSENDFPVAQKSIFGWLLAGPLNEPYQQHTNATHLTAFLSNFEANVDHILQRFWISEELSDIRPYTPEETQCEQSYVNTTSRNEFGRIVVQIPFKLNPPKLGNSLHSAISRLHAMERRFAHDERLKIDYVQFMSEYESLGHMLPIPSNEIYNKLDENIFYLPHHAVRKESSTTTKLRVVFDASCKSTTGVSLNDTMLVGPTIQNSLIDILIRFRKHEIVFTADIEKMFRQIHVHKKHCDYQRIVWRTNPSKPVTHYHLVTVTYGTASASFLATRSLHQLAIEQETDYPITANTIKNDFYMDDLMTGAANLIEAQTIRDEINSILKSGGLHLRKWASNSPLFLKDLPIEDKEIKPRNIDEDPTYIKLLGIQWNPQQDTFSFKINVEPLEEFTKRRMLSEAGRIFDPLGWLAPVTIFVKILFQQLWVKNVSWDDTLPEEIASKWSKIRKQYSYLEQIQIPRKIFTNECSIELIGFSDASELAFCAVIYVRCFNKDGSIKVNLLTSKTRVAPIKTISLPRLELNAALLLTRLMKSVKSSLNIPNIQIRAFTDSMIVLAWLESFPRTWKTFVSNRVSEIIDFWPRHHWNHIPTTENPADLATRGSYPEDIISQTLWWCGPHWLERSEDEWPVTSAIVRDFKTIQREKRNIKTFIVTSELDLQGSFHEELIKRFSSWSKLINVTAMCMRFIKILKKGSQSIKLKCSTVLELRDAENSYIKHIQQQHFAEEIKCLKSNHQIPSKSQLSALDPFLDGEILRVGGRLRHSLLRTETKHPIILPYSSTYTELLIDHYHIKYLHANTTSLITLLRQKYWILNCKRAVKTAIHRCLTCFRYKRHNNNQFMGDLPAARVQASRPFLHSGVDFAGPIHLKLRKGRCRQTSKGYIVLIICLSTKAIHLDVATDLSSQEFLAVLRRFTGRRGIPSDMYSDNATNFVGCNKFLKELFSKQSNYIEQSLHQDGINWHFIPPLSPHFGGIWESNVKGVKYYLKRVVGDKLLTYDELSTLLIQIEALLNSRPLSINSNDEFNPLTPAHFLIGQPLTLIPEPNLLDVKMSLLNRWQQLQQSMQQFWDHWHKNYLTCLNQRPKWRHRSPNLCEGGIVLLIDSNVPPGQWPLGKIIKLHPGQDSLVRVASVKTKSGEFKRNITKLCRLPTNI